MNAKPPTRTSKLSVRRWFWVFLLACLTFTCLWAADIAKLPKVEKPVPNQLEIIDSDTHLNKTPPRRTKGLDLVKMGWSYNCMECHKSLEAKWHHDDRAMVEHETIKLNHGNNRFCLNCHHPTNRNVFVDYDGSEIAEQDVVLLCARCHGTTYRDWQAGAHGRRNGYWDKSKGGETQLRCIQCPDPHDPKFKAIESLHAPTYPKRAAGSEHGTVPGKKGH